MNNVLPFNRNKDRERKSPPTSIEISITTEILEDGSVWYRIDNGPWIKLDMEEDTE